MSTTPRAVTLVAAYARGRVIGSGPDIPWHSREDFAHFKATTLGHTLVMGRLTHESIGRPLPGRRTIVVTRDPAWRDDGVDVAHSFEQALELAGDAEVFVAGGGRGGVLPAARADPPGGAPEDLGRPRGVHHPGVGPGQGRRG